MRGSFTHENGIRSLARPTRQAGADAAFVGWANGLYSVGRLVAAPLFGWWSEQRSYREAIVVNLCIFIFGADTTRPSLAEGGPAHQLMGGSSARAGNLLYALSEHHKWMILIARMLVGLGSGASVIGSVTVGRKH